MKKKFFTLFAALTLSAGALFASDTAVNGIYYDFDDANLTATVTFSDAAYEYYTGDVVIPATVTYGGNTYSVTSIEVEAFAGCSGLTSITIPNSVTSIGDYAFYECSGLTSVTIPNSVTSIGDDAFDGCSGLTSVTIPNSVTSIGDYAFYECSGLTSVTIPNSVTSIGSGAFYGTAWLANQPDGVIYINQSLYTYKGEMPANTSIVVRDGTTQICGGAFSGCSSLTSVTIPNSVTSIGGWAFEGTAWLANQSDGVIYINQSLYTYKGEMPANTSIVVRDGTIQICGGAFDGCSGLTSVTIPNSVTSIGVSAFESCSGLTSVTIPNSVTSIGEGAFYQCSGLTSVTIPNSVTNIGRWAFSGCSGLTSVTIPNSVTSIGSSAFAYCSGLTSVTIPNSVTSIGEGAFYGCSGLTSITIPNSVTSIGGGAFAYCSGLTSVVWNAKNCADFAQYYDYSSSKYYYGPFDDSASKITSFTFGSEVEHIPAYLCYGMENLTSVTIPNSVTSIGEKAFRGCSGLTSVTIPNSVTSIGEYAFYGCSGLTSVVWNAKNCADFSYNSAPFYNIKSQITSFTFGSEVEHIPAYLCYGMENLTSVTIPNSVTSIGGAAFYGCSGLTSVTIPNSVTSIGYGAFYYCSGLTAVTIGNSVTSIGKNTFYECSGLTSVVWNAKNCADFAEYYDEYDYYGPFYNIASQITSFTFGSAVEHIPAYLCYDMKNLTSVTIPNSVTSIGYYAFEGCTALHEITALPTVPPTCGSNAFYNVPTDVTLRCPCASREAYQAADTWSQFSNVTLTDFPNVTLLADEEHGSVQVEDRICESKSIVISATPQIGYVFARWSDGNTENPRTILLTHDITLTAEFGLAYSGKCGDNLYWEYKQNKLFITGSGDMYDFTVETRPWKLLLADIESIEISAGTTSIGESAFADCSGLTSITIPNSVTSIGLGAFAGCSGLTSVTIPNSVTSIGNYAFDECSSLTSITIPNSVTSIEGGAFWGCSGLTSVTIGNSVTSIGEEAFSGCTKLINIVCYAAEPPSCDASVFANYNVFLKVPCNNLMAYQTHVCWGSFKYISCIGSEEVQVTEFSVTPSTNEAQFTWPAEPNAATYELVISKDGVVFCTLTFNASGQLMGIAFAPGANTAATTATSGFQFTVTGLDEASHYTYTFDAKDAGGSVVKHYAGEFNTDGSVGLEQIELSGLYTQAGRIVCEGEFRIYDLLGRDVTRLNGSLSGVYVVKTANAAVKVVVK